MGPSVSKFKPGGYERGPAREKCLTVTPNHFSKAASKVLVVRHKDFNIGRYTEISIVTVEQRFSRVRVPHDHLNLITVVCVDDGAGQAYTDM